MVYVIEKKIGVGVLAGLFFQFLCFVWCASAAFSNQQFHESRITALEKKSDVYSEILQRLATVEAKLDVFIGSKSKNGK